MKIESEAQSVQEIKTAYKDFLEDLSHLSLLSHVKIKKLKM